MFWPLIAPSTTAELTIYYLFWSLAYGLVAITVDIRSPNTPAFRLADLGGKHHIFYNATGFANSLLILVGLMSPTVAKLAGDTIVPLLLASLSGCAIAISAIDPRK